MRHRLLGIGEPATRCARSPPSSPACATVLYDWSVTYKLELSVLALAVAFAMRAWLDFALIMLATAFVLFAEIINSAIEALCWGIAPPPIRSLPGSYMLLRYCPPTS